MYEKEAREELKKEREKVVEEIEKETDVDKISGRVIREAGEAFKRDMISYAEYFQLILQDVRNIQLNFIREKLDGIDISVGLIYEEGYKNK